MYSPPESPKSAPWENWEDTTSHISTRVRARAFPLGCVEVSLQVEKHRRSEWSGGSQRDNRHTEDNKLGWKRTFIKVSCLIEPLELVGVCALTSVEKTSPAGKRN